MAKIGFLICFVTCVSVLFAGEVLFSCSYPEDPPDFIFGSEDADFFPNIVNIKVSWKKFNRFYKMK